ncbi:MAG: hypothetical protein J6R47_06595 [Acholeplasmatales bacterium]|nr:hypothetical protein [Acholeplasmatales bacterium]
MYYLLKDGTIVEGTLTKDKLMIKVKTDIGWQFIESEEVVAKSENLEVLKNGNK